MHVGDYGLWFVVIPTRRYKRTTIFKKDQESFHNINSAVKHVLENGVQHENKIRCSAAVRWHGDIFGAMQITIFVKEKMAYIYLSKKSIQILKNPDKMQKLLFEKLPPMEDHGDRHIGTISLK